MFIKKIKQCFFDKKKDVSYNTQDEWALIRKTFPWLQRIDDKKVLSKMLRETSPEIIKLLSTYYWSEVNELIAQKRYWDIIKYEWIQKLISDLDYLYVNPNEYATWDGRNDGWN